MNSQYAKSHLIRSFLSLLSAFIVLTMLTGCFVTPDEHATKKQKNTPAQGETKPKTPTIKLIEPFNLAPEQGIAIPVTRLDELNNFQLEQTDGTTILLPLVNRFEIKDFNFDEYPDLRVSQTKGANTVDLLLVYDPKTNLYQKVQLSEFAQKQMACPFLSNLNTSEQGKQKYITSLCAIGMTQNMNMDYFRLTSNHSLVLAEQYIYQEETFPEELEAYSKLSWGMSQKRIRYDEQENLLDTTRVSQALVPIVLKVYQSDFNLYAQPNHQQVITKTHANEVCSVLALKNDWLELQCQQGKGWLNWREAIAASSKPFVLVESISARLY